MKHATACARLTLDDVLHAADRLHVLRAKVEIGRPVDAILKAQIRSSLAKALSHFNQFDWTSYPEAEAIPVEDLDAIIPRQFQAVSPDFPNQTERKGA